MNATVDPRTLFLRACALDVAVRKPGNVSRASPGHGMDAQLFLDSADAAQHGLFMPGARVGERIEAAVTATLEVAGCNTNLGIVLLCAPLALAIERCATPCNAPRLRRSLEGVLAGLDVEDARAAYRAIAAAHPGGLGRAERQDVEAEPTVSLLEAMRLAADRDRIAVQYATGYEDLFGTGLATLAAHAPDPAPASGEVGEAAVQALYLAFLGRWPDSHIVRKFGPAQAQAVTDEAAAWRVRAERGATVGADPAFAVWDDTLKRRGLNPGTSADLTVAALFIAGAVGVSNLPVPP